MSKRGARNYAFIAIALVLFAYITIQIEISQIFNFIAPCLPEQIAVFQPNTQSTVIYALFKQNNNDFFLFLTGKKNDFKAENHHSWKVDRSLLR